MKVLSILAAAAAFVGAGTAMAQTMPANPTATVPSVSFAHIEPVLREAGFQTQITGTSNGAVMTVVSGNRRLQLFQRACSTETTCAGLWMFAFIEDSNNLQMLNEFNKVSKPARATIINDSIALDRYLIADFGTTKGSLTVNMVVFMSMIDEWFKFSQKSNRLAVSFDPLMQPQAATSIEGVDHEMMEALEAMAQDAAYLNSSSSLNNVTGER